METATKTPPIDADILKAIANGAHRLAAITVACFPRRKPGGYEGNEKVIGARLQAMARARLIICKPGLIKAGGGWRLVEAKEAACSSK